MPKLCLVTKNILVNQVTKDLEVAPYRVTLEESNEYLKPMGLTVRR